MYTEKQKNSYIFSNPEKVPATKFVAIDIESSLGINQNKFTEVVQISLTTYNKEFNLLFEALHKAFPEDTLLHTSSCSYFANQTEYTFEVQDSPNAVRILEALFIFALKFKFVFVAHWAAFDFSQICNYYPFLRTHIIKLLKSNLITCTKLRETLLSIGLGRYEFDFRFSRRAPKYSLAMLANVYLQKELHKKAIQSKGEVVFSDAWRLNYLHLSYHKMKDWPASAIEYATDDTSICLAVCLKQTRRKVLSPSGDLIAENNVVVDEYRQTRGEFGLTIAAGTGFTRHNPSSVEFISKAVRKVKALTPFEQKIGLKRSSETVSFTSFIEYMEQEHSEVLLNTDSDLIDYYKTEIFPAIETVVAADKNKNKIGTSNKLVLQTIVKKLFDYFKLDVQITKKGIELISERVIHYNNIPTKYIQCNKDALNMIPCPIIRIYTSNVIFKSLVNAFAPIVKNNQALIADINSLLSSGRASMTTPPLMVAPRTGGFRECLSVNEDQCLNVADFETNELRTLAEVCYYYFQYSILGDTLNSGADPHSKMGSELLGISYEEFMKIRASGSQHSRYKEIDNARQTGKVGDFGVPGGLGAESFVKFARQNYNVIMTLDQAREIINTFKNLFYEIKDYFKAVGRITASGVGDVVQLYSKRVRGSIKFTQACNTYFQGLAADGAKACVFEIVAATLVKNEKYPSLYDSNCRLIGFVHDEFISKGPDRSTAWADDISKLQVEIMSLWTPNVTSIAEPALVYRYSKAAKLKRNSGKQLIPCDEKPEGMFKADPYIPKYVLDYLKQEEVICL